MIKRLLALLLGMFWLSATATGNTYMTERAFLDEVFSKQADQPKQPNTLWIDEDLQTRISTILGHPYAKLRLRYWRKDHQFVWFLDEIGKERPISFAVYINEHKVQTIKVLAFRESRGGEIRFEAFTRQFEQMALDDKENLNRNIDGITGATMSVNAMKKITRLALLLTNHIDP